MKTFWLSSAHFRFTCLEMPFQARSQSCGRLVNSLEPLGGVIYNFDIADIYEKLLGYFNLNLVPAGLLPTELEDLQASCAYLAKHLS
jgi:hypothetical protein